MDIREVVGQLVIVSIEGSEWSRDIAELFDRHHCGGAILFAENITENAEQVKELNRKIRETAFNAHGRYPFISVDEEGGRVSRLRNLIGTYPSALAVSNEGDDAVFKSYKAMSEKVKLLGFNTAWAPVLDINTNPENPIIGDRSFGSSPETVAKKGAAAIRGIKEAGLFACGKHFPGHGDTFIDSHLSLPVQDTSLNTLRERELVPFKMAVSEDIEFMMTAHILFKDIDPEFPATFSPRILADILRGELGYRGLIVTDDLNMGAVKENYSLEERILLAMEGGADILLIRDSHEGILKFIDTFVHLAREGLINEKKLMESYARAARLKEKLN